MGMWKLLAVIFLAFMILPVMTYADTTIQHVKIPLVTGIVTVPANINLTSPFNLTTPDGMNSTVYVDVVGNGYFQPNSMIFLWIDNKTCNNPNFTIPVGSYFTQQEAHFDCRNIITSQGTYNFTAMYSKAPSTLSTWIDVGYINNPVGNVKYVGGTDYWQGERATVFLQLQNADGSAVNNASCNFDMYNTSNPLLSPIYNKQPMVFRGAEGIYYYQFQTIGLSTGVYPLDAQCTYIYDNFYYYTGISPVINVTTNAGNPLGGSPFSLNSGSDAQYMQWNGVPNITLRWDNVSANITQLDFIFTMVTSGSRTFSFYAKNKTSGGFQFIGSVVASGNGINEPDLFTSNIPLDFLNSTGSVSIQVVQTAGGGSTNVYFDWATLKAYRNSTYVAEVKGSSEVHIYPINISDMPQQVWNYTNRSLTEFNFPITATTNNTAIAQAVWNYTPNRTLTDYNLTGISGNQSVIISNQNTINNNILQVNTTTQNTYTYLTGTIYPFLTAMNSTLSSIQSTLNTVANNIVTILGITQRTENNTIQINTTVNAINAKNYTPTIVVNTTVNLTNTTNTYNNTQVFNYTQNVTAVFNVTVDNITNTYNYTQNVTVAPVFNVTTQNVTVQNVSVVVNSTSTNTTNNYNNTQVFNYTQNVTVAPVFNVTQTNTTNIYNYTQNVTVSPVFNVTTQNVTVQNVTVVVNQTDSNNTQIYNNTNTYNYTQNVTAVFNVTVENTTQIFNYTQNVSVTPVFNVTVDNVTNNYNNTQVFNYTQNVTVSPVFNVTTQNVTVQNVSVVVNQTDTNTTNNYNNTQVFNYTQNVTAVFNVTVQNVTNEYNNTQIFNYTNIYNNTENVTVSPVFNVTTQNVTVQNVSVVVNTTNLTFDYSTQAGYVWNYTPNRTLTDYNNTEIFTTVNDTNSRVIDLNITASKTYDLLLIVNSTVNAINLAISNLQASVNGIISQLFTMNATINRIENNTIQINSSIQQISSQVWNYSNRSLTEFNFPINVTINSTDIANAVWSASTRTLTDYNMTGINGLLVDINGTVYETKNIVQNAANLTAAEVWNYTSRELTNDNNTQIYMLLTDVNGTVVENRNLLQGMSNLTAFQVWNATQRTLTDYNNTNLSASIWAYTNRTLTDYNTTQLFDMLTDVNATAYRIENNTIEINGTTQNTYSLLLAINGSLVPNTVYIW